MNGEGVPVSDRLLRAALAPPEGLPRDELVAAVLDRVERTGQRRSFRLALPSIGWSMTTDTRQLARLGLVAMLVLSLVAVLVFVGQQRETRLPLANGVVSFGRSGDIWAADPQGAAPSNLTATPDVHEGDPRWSPDGSRVAFFAWDREDVNRVDVMRADGSERRTLTPPGYRTHAWALSWSPDGMRLVVDTSVRGIPRILILPIDGSAATELPVPGPAFAPTWSPDGERIAFLRQVGGDERVSLIAPDGSALRDLPLLSTGHGSLYALAWSPDGTQLVVTRRELSPRFRAWIAIFDLGSGIWQEVPFGDLRVDWAAWSPDGRFLAVSIHVKNCVYEVHVVAADGSNRRRIADNAWLGSWSPDGEEVLLVQHSARPDDLTGGLVAVRIADGSVRRIVDMVREDLPPPGGNGTCARYPGFGGVGWQGMKR